ncbi:N-acetyltransferase family protein [Janibacter sp. G56]|uniref:GNAT family N-acetyltransferase n=1 Tax=Janibacter sp. G56 TaxID=3418717 RepID=UPI003D07A006
MTDTHGHDHGSHDHGAHAHGAHDHDTQAPGPLADASVRRATVTDAPAVGLVQAEVWREAYATTVPAEVLATFQPQSFAKAWRESLANPPAGVHRLMVACAGDQVVGFAAVGPTQDPDADSATAEVLALGVHPAARRQGHGSRLLNACVDILREAGATTMHAWLLHDHEATRAFLGASGLQPDGAYRDRIVSPAGDTAREVRLVASLLDPDEP